LHTAASPTAACDDPWNSGKTQSAGSAATGSDRAAVSGSAAATATEGAMSAG
jgi:hypothetical protein